MYDGKTDEVEKLHTMQKDKKSHYDKSQVSRPFLSMFIFCLVLVVISLMIKSPVAISLTF